MGFRLETDVLVPMRDGVTLATDVWIPDGEQPRPVLLVRHPYGKARFPQMVFIPSTRMLLEAGYCVVWQDCRGMFGSSGDFRVFVDDFADGADTIGWLRAQPWCDGTVGMYGLSYLGNTQLAAAAEAPDGLRAITPTVAPADPYEAPWYSPGGAPHWHTMLTWSAQQALLCEITALERGAGDLDRMLGVTRVLNESASELAKLPMSDHPALDDAAPWLAEWLSHPERDDYWRARAPLERVENFEVPALHVGGWFDLFLDNGVRTYLAIRDRAATEAARTEQRLIIGPWDHLNQEGVYHGRNFGPSAAVYAADVYGAHLRFFDRHLRGNTEVDTGPPVRIFVMGIDEWRDEQAWPLPDTEYVDYFLDGAGAANTLDGDGVLTTTPPTSLAVDTIVYDPADPAPTLGGRIILPVPVGAGPVDQRPAEERPDVLCFTTPVLERPVEVTGHIRLVLHASSSALDTDFTGKLVDVFPDGRALYLTDGILRGRYRDSLEKAELLEPDRVYELTLDLSVTSNVFLPGHRIRLEVSSSNFPRYGRNTNSGGVIAEDGVNDLVVATNRVFHGPGHTSRLVLPIIRR